MPLLLTPQVTMRDRGPSPATSVLPACEAISAIAVAFDRPSFEQPPSPQTKIGYFSVPPRVGGPEDRAFAVRNGGLGARRGFQNALSRPVTRRDFGPCTPCTLYLRDSVMPADLIKVGDTFDLTISAG